MNIKLLNTLRASINEVKVDYSLDGTVFTVEWNNIHPGTGEIGDYDLMLNASSLDEGLTHRVNEAIRQGESDGNEDLELYLALRDTFSAEDCLAFGWDSYIPTYNEVVVEFDDSYVGSYGVNVWVTGKSFYVVCQTETDHNYKELASLSCVNESGEDFSDCGLADYLMSLGIDQYSETSADIQERINACAESHMPENSVVRVLGEKLGLNDDSIEYVESLFGAYGPTDVMHFKYKTSDGLIIVTSEDSSENVAEKILLGVLVFESNDEYESWWDKINPEGRHGDCSVSYRAWKNICGIGDCED